MSTGLYNPKNGIISTCVYSNTRGESKRNINNCTFKVQEILPVEHTTKYSGRQVNYLRTRVELITEQTLQQMYEHITKEDVKIMETPKFFIVQYDKKPPILVSKENGRLYYIEALGYDKAQVEHQAATLLSIWNKRGLVDGYTRSRICLLNGRKIQNKERFRSHCLK